jgi:hypothetical protein
LPCRSTRAVPCFLARSSANCAKPKHLTTQQQNDNNKPAQCVRAESGRKLGTGLISSWRSSLRGQVSAEKVTRIHAEHERDKTQDTRAHASSSSNGLAASTLIGDTLREIIGRTSRTESLKSQVPVSMCRPSVSRASQVWSAVQSWRFCRQALLARRRAGVAQSEARLLGLGVVQTPAESRRCRRSR